MRDDECLWKISNQPIWGRGHVFSEFRRHNVNWHAGTAVLVIAWGSLTRTEKKRCDATLIIWQVTWECDVWGLLSWGSLMMTSKTGLLLSVSYFISVSLCSVPHVLPLIIPHNNAASIWPYPQCHCQRLARIMMNQYTWCRCESITKNNGSVWAAKEVQQTRKMPSVYRSHECVVPVVDPLSTSLWRKEKFNTFSDTGTQNSLRFTVIIMK